MVFAEKPPTMDTEKNDLNITMERPKTLTGQINIKGEE